MKLSFKFKPKFSDKTLAIIEELSFHTTKLYNIANYHNRELEVLNYSKMNSEYSKNWHKSFLHSHTYQHCLKILEKNWKSYFASIKDYSKNPSKYKGKPQKPKFKNKTSKNEIIFTNFAIRVKENSLILSISKSMQKKFRVKSLNFNLPEKIKSLVDFSKLQQIKIKWDSLSKKWYLILIYLKNENKENFSKYSNVMAIDLGLDNLATVCFLENKQSYIINGKSIKSKNSYFNKEIAYLQSIRMKQVENIKFKNTKKIIKLRQLRNNYILDYMHKASKKIIDLAIENKVNEIVLGDLKNIKQNSFLKSFTQIPIQQLVELIKYKAQLIGIKINLINEAYTSGVSALDLEKISKKNYNKSRRITRGLFKTNNDLKINADLNGSINILRKHIKDKCIPKLIKSVMDNGCVDHPIRIRVA